MYSGYLFNPLLLLVIRLRRVQRRILYIPYYRSYTWIRFMLIRVLRVKTYTQNMAIVGDFDQTEA